jgi:uncharacterized membrane protein required for colicin V production
MSFLSNLNVGWVDLLIVVLLGVGVWRGRKRGMSEELLDVIKWVLIVAAAALVYEPLGRFLHDLTPFSLFSCYVTVYLTTLAIVFLTFAAVRRSVGQKVVEAEAFGPAEYYLGMAAGAFRFGCMILVGMSLLNARHFTPEEVRAQEKYQLDNYGSSFFPTLPGIQDAVFKDSYVGKSAREYVFVVFIKPTRLTPKGLANTPPAGSPWAL